MVLTNEEIKELGNFVAKEQTGMQEFKELAQTDTSDVVTALINKTTIEMAQDCEIMQDKIKDHAGKVIDTHFDTHKHEMEQKNTDAVLARNKFARKVFGQGDDVSLWQQKLMVILSNIWFVIYVVIAFFTIVPIGVFAEGLTKVFKRGWLAITLSVIIYLLIVTSPLWGRLF